MHVTSPRSSAMPEQVVPWNPVNQLLPEYHQSAMNTVATCTTIKADGRFLSSSSSSIPCEIMPNLYGEVSASSIKLLLTGRYSSGPVLWIKKPKDVKRFTIKPFHLFKHNFKFELPRRLKFRYYFSMLIIAFQTQITHVKRWHGFQYSSPASASFRNPAYRLEWKFLSVSLHDSFLCGLSYLRTAWWLFIYHVVHDLCRTQTPAPATQPMEPPWCAVSCTIIVTKNVRCWDGSKVVGVGRRGWKSVMVIRT